MNATRILMDRILDLIQDSGVSQIEAVYALDAARSIVPTLEISTLAPPSDSSPESSRPIR
jgi:hypothetical protein